MSARTEPLVRLHARTRFVEDPLDPLEALPADGFAWWHGEWGFATAGVAAVVTPDAVAATLATITTDDEVGEPGGGAIAVGALSFAAGPSDRFVVPTRVRGVDTAGRSWLTTIGAAPGLSSLPDTEPTRFTVTRVHDRARWRAMVGRALDEISGQRMDKVVLAREVVVDADAPFDRAAVLQRLRAHERGCFVFGTADLGDGRGSLVGASPELLVRRRGRSLLSRPMAGTVPVADAEGLAHLARSPKLAHEHRIVIDAVTAALAPRCTAAPAVAGPRPTPVGDLAHLTTEIRGELAEPLASALELARALHPTPAVGGTPTGAALDLIRELEPEGRDRYAGAVGWVDAHGDGELAVALRSAELQGTHARLFAGAGIVAGSDPDVEWTETEAKLAPMLRALVRP